ncbi:MAG: hypothetical protein KBD14_02900 [Candidatus Pacebacteria bacterium]|nr:hypothetical protein [Candidatus Paceibacterota bacterium]
MDILAIFQDLQRILLSEIEKNIKARDDAQNEANSHGGAKVSRYDTFKEEAQYLVDGYKKKIIDLEHDLSILKGFLSNFSFKDNSCVRLGNFVKTEDEKGNNRFYLYSPSAGGQKINFGNNIIIVITPSSPFGKVLLGKKVNEEINLGIKQKIILIQ